MPNTQIHHVQIFQVITKKNKQAIIDRMKLKRAITKYEEQVKTDQEIELCLSKPEMISFDGKKDKTLVSEIDENGRSRVVVHQEEHFTIISEPGSKYLTHLTPGSKGEDIAEAIYSYLVEKNLLGSVKQSTQVGRLVPLLELSTRKVKGFCGQFVSCM